VSEPPPGSGSGAGSDPEAGLDPETGFLSEPDLHEGRVKVSGTGAVARTDRPARRRRVRRRRIIAGVIGTLAVLFLAVVFWYELQSHALGSAGRRVIVEVNNGASVDSVVAKLSTDHVIGSTLAFRISDLIHGSPTIIPGHYLLHENQTFAQVRAILDAGPNILAVTVNPGLTLHEVAERVDDLPGHGEGSFAKIAASGVVHSAFSPAGSNNLEGMLGTGNYLILPGETDTAILTTMVDRFDAQATAAGLSTSSAAAFGLTPYQIITAASIVWKEGYIPKNMPDVARVIYNRLAADMPLQMNSTVLYSLGQDGGPVTSADLKLQTPYNTYLHSGLTPTPICSPSMDALSAAVHPPAGNWLYFVVVQKDGTEAFADTYQEQLANEKLAKQRGVG
jgi:UPF0755 protein